MKTVSAIFAAGMGVLMIDVWAVLLVTGRHDLRTAPFENGSLLAAEALTALALLAGGFGVLMRKPWGPVIHHLSLGMMLYTAVNSIGVFAQARVFLASVLFAALTLITVGLIVGCCRESRAEGPVPMIR